MFILLFLQISLDVLGFLFTFVHKIRRLIHGDYKSNKDG
jgi:hypothetical protein